MKRLCLCLLLLTACDTAFSGCGSPPPPVEREFFEEQKKIIEDRNKTPRERTMAIVAFNSFCGCTPGVQLDHDRFFTSMSLYGGPLCVRIAAANRAGENPPPRPDLVEEALESDDEVAHEVLVRIAQWFTPVNLLRALKHPSANVREAGLKALNLSMGWPAKLSDKAAEVLRPLLQDLPREEINPYRDWRWAGALSAITNETGTFNPELRAIARCSFIPPVNRASALKLLNGQLEPLDLDAAVDVLPRQPSEMLELLRKAGSLDRIEKVRDICDEKDEKGLYKHYFSEEFRHRLQKVLDGFEGRKEKEEAGQ